MATYFIDTEFLEGSQKSWFGRNTKPTIDLVSIGIVSSDNREYYAISKDFNLKEAWNRFDWKEHKSLHGEKNLCRKEYWIRDNVLKPIFQEFKMKAIKDIRLNGANCFVYSPEESDMDFIYSDFKKLINRYGKTNFQISEEVRNFVYKGGETFERFKEYHNEISIEFYGYYCDYDWVVFCWLFGKMIDLPKGFPMYCNDLKQTLDEKCVKWANDVKGIRLMDLKEQLEYFKKQENYPKQINEHNALADARWNKQLYEFLNKL